MGLLILPAMLGMFLVFSYSGVKLGVETVRKAQGRATAILVLLVLAACLNTAALTLGFAVIAGRAVYPFVFAIALPLATTSLAWLGGDILHTRFKTSGRPLDGVAASAVYLAAAGFPFSYFAYAETLERFFGIRWIY